MVSTLRRSDWEGRSVFLTGHTGFKGSWLALMLEAFGARVHGYALDPDTGTSMFGVANVEALVASDTRADLADRDRLAAAMASAVPDLVLHLAAQPLVRESYKQPVRTFATNVMGTAHLLEAVRSTPSVKAVVIVTTDKVYENDGRGIPFVETDRLGGDDPYSASKAAAEFVTASYRHSFFREPAAPRVASARAGNVIGGGDWAPDRLVPDCMRAFTEGAPVRLRYPAASRPWQHVLEPLSGYMTLAQALLSGADAAHAWNFGPPAADQAAVGDVARVVAELWGGDAMVLTDDVTVHPHEAGLLALDSARAVHDLAWQPRWPLRRALQETVAWQKQWLAGGDMQTFSRKQIAAYLESTAS
ncbi:CDP-glucose 4,6-dehydratase [Luteibacter sp. ME-Dv--P-043b]|uniref:CDP-glucose 4,6-dehydratase n=1 Tax=Luteibacter sp. ME-Dv--P-043b TaxID=3040291 RepID=UPI0025561B80|nr:CDP-glucose 4,6-dehydratase [Luteibacter sp. ME-Dv--P-043b]